MKLVPAGLLVVGQYRDVAVLTYQLAQSNGSATRYGNATQVYGRKHWRVIHTHWPEAKERQS